MFQGNSRIYRAGATVSGLILVMGAILASGQTLVLANHAGRLQCPLISMDGQMCFHPSRVHQALSMVSPKHAFNPAHMVWTRTDHQLRSIIVETDPRSTTRGDAIVFLSGWIPATHVGLPQHCPTRPKFVIVSESRNLDRPGTHMSWHHGCWHSTANFAHKTMSYTVNANYPKSFVRRLGAAIRSKGDSKGL